MFSGNTYMSLQFTFRVGNNTIGRIVPETCRAIYKVLAKEYFKVCICHRVMLIIMKC